MEDPTSDRRATAPGLRQVTLPDGTRLAVRPVESSDVDGLVELCASLREEDRYRRFFSGYTPDRTFFEHAVRIGERGGCGLVAVVSGERGRVRIAGEASYETLPNGDGELAMMVAPDWRGWLGPYLLDALVEAAAVRGVPNIEADVLVTNRPMLRLLRSRGYAVMPSHDWVSMRLVIGTSGPTPVWPPGHERPRVLVEVPGGRWHAAAATEEAGLAVIACSGPRGPRTRCPALAGEPCPLVTGADAVVVSHPRDDPGWDRLVEAHPRLHPGVPVCVEPRDRPPVTGEGAAEGQSAGDHEETEASGATDPEKVVVGIVDRLARGHIAGGSSARSPSPCVEGIDKGAPRPPPRSRPDDGPPEARCGPVGPAPTAHRSGSFDP